MSTVAGILKTKVEEAVHTIAATASALEAAQLMAQKNIGALLVVEDGRIIGLLTERDDARKLVPMDRPQKRPWRAGCISRWNCSCEKQTSRSWSPASM